MSKIISYHNVSINQSEQIVLHDVNLEIGEGEFVYFVHSFYVPVCAQTIATTNYVLPFSAALHKDNFYATQFHPEKSGSVGERIIKNFLEL